MVKPLMIVTTAVFLVAGCSWSPQTGWQSEVGYGASGTGGSSSGSRSGSNLSTPCDTSHSTYECLNYRASNVGGP